MDDRPIAEAKSALRSAARSARRVVTGQAREHAAHEIARRVIELPEMRDVRAVALFSPMAEEADVSVLEGLLRDAGVRIAYPRIAGERVLCMHWTEGAESCEPGPMGILSPRPDAAETSLGDLDAVIVPGVAFDRACNRLGHGKGYYDALIERLPDGIHTIGVAYDEQLTNAVPCESHDQPLDVLVTPTSVYRHLG